MDDPRAAVHSLVRRNLGAQKLVFSRPAKAVPGHVARGMRPEEAFRAILLDCHAQIAANAALVRAGRGELRSVEGLHQLRVAFRRLDVALGAFGREFGQDWMKELRGRAKILAGRLAPARDLDVFVTELLAQAPQARGIPGLRERAETARQAAWIAAAECATGEDFERLVDDVAALASSQLPLTRRRHLPKTARRILDHQARRVKKRGKTARSEDEGDLHRLRIAVKKLRYSAEFFAPLYCGHKVRKYLKKLRALQNHLGRLNDIANARATVGELLKIHGRKAAAPETSFAGGAVMGWFGAQSPHAVRHALKRYRKFRRIKPFWH
jgi:CHAD domain-containing protein